MVLVSSGAIMVGSRTLGYDRKPATLSEKQACAAIGQAKLMMIYQKLFSEYNQVAGQILMTKSIMLHSANRKNARNTFCQLLSMGAIPIVNENDTISTHEIQFGDNDTLSAVVAALIGADLLILLSDIDGLHLPTTPIRTPDARFIDVVEKLDDRMRRMGKDTPRRRRGRRPVWPTKLKAAAARRWAPGPMWWRLPTGSGFSCDPQDHAGKKSREPCFWQRSQGRVLSAGFPSKAHPEKEKRSLLWNRKKIRPHQSARPRKSKAEGLTEEEKAKRPAKGCPSGDSRQRADESESL
ncbi:MAG: glutamate 5-kinase [Lachnospiraceae bacterium]